MYRKIMFTLGAMASLIVPSGAEALSGVEKEVLLSKIESLENAVIERNMKSQRSAISTFKSAMHSDAATFRLYLDCLEKIALEEQKKKGEDVREKTRKLREDTSDAFKRALRHQLYWLVYSMEAAQDEDRRQHSAQQLVTCLVNILDDANKLDAKNTINGGVLQQSPYGSVFAKAYQIGHLKPEDWPSNPMDFDGLYKGLIVQDLIERGDYDGARQQWTIRLNAERRLIDAYADDPDSKKYGDSSVALDRYLTKRVPALRWQNETALYAAGDVRQASLELFDILENYPEHPQYLSWVQWFKDRLAGVEETAE